MQFRRLLAAIALLTLPALAAAQPIVVNLPPGTRPRTVPVTATVLVGGAFSATPAAPALEEIAPQPANLCNPGNCFIGSISVRANQQWQIQVRVKAGAPSNFYVSWITPAPQSRVRLTNVWTTIGSGTGPSTGTALPLLFNANKTTGRLGFVPTASQLAGYLEYQVIALP